MLKEKQEGNDGGGWRGKKDDKQGLWGFHPAFLLILIIYGLLKSHQNMMIKKKNKKQNWMFLVAYFKEKCSGFWNVRTMNPKANLWNKQQYLNHKLFFIYDSFLEVDQ